MALLVLYAFISGIATIASPCILPVLPAVLGGGLGGGARRPLGIAAGFAASFAVFTLVLSSLVAATGLSPDALRLGAAALVAFLGLAALVPRLGAMLESGLSRLTARAAARIGSRATGASTEGRPPSFAGGFVLGAGLGLVWTPCVGPIMASVASLAIARAVDGGVAAIAAAYAVGAALPMLAVMVGGRKAAAALAKAARGGRGSSPAAGPRPDGGSAPEKSPRPFGARPAAGILMLATAAAVATGADRAFQAALIRAFPAYGAGLTALESGPSVLAALRARKEKAEGKTAASAATPTAMPGADGADAAIAPESFVATAAAMRGYAPAEARFAGVMEPSSGGMLLDYGRAPDLAAAGPWLGGGALTAAETRGKVLLVDFWTYSCVNCVRTIPALRAWRRAYESEGLVVVGVHSPEFEFEKSTANLAAAIKSLGVDWRVVQDNDYGLWNAFSNLYWPAHYLVDARGRVRYVHFGEGGYEDTEMAIRSLLAEAAAMPGGAAATAVPIGAGGSGREAFAAPPEPDLQDRTPEMYLGYARGRGFASAVAPVADAAVDYAPAGEPGNAEWSLEGRWTISAEYSAPEGAGALELGYDAKDLFLVLQPAGRGGEIRVLVDGVAPPDTEDVKSGLARPSAARMYRLASFPEAAFRRLRLEVKGPVRLFAFTFG